VRVGANPVSLPIRFSIVEPQSDGRVKQGDIVTIDNRGADQTQDPYVWFARKPGFTAFSYTNPTPGGWARARAYPYSAGRDAVRPPSRDFLAARNRRSAPCRSP
jgi:hypothetical protein